MEYCLIGQPEAYRGASRLFARWHRAEQDPILSVRCVEPSKRGVKCMVKVVYEVVQHDGGWAYRLGNVYSEAFPTHSEALEAARIVAAEQQVGGDSAEISWQDDKGKWHEEYAEGGDRPETEVVDGNWKIHQAATSPRA
jgi:hypothetical protein